MMTDMNPLEELNLSDSEFLSAIPLILSPDDNTSLLAEERANLYLNTSNPFPEPVQEIISEVANPDPELMVPGDQYFTEYHPPERKIFSGPYNFEVRISSTDTSKKKYLYSHYLNRFYVDMHSEFAVHFKWDPVGPHCMYVRSCVVFADDEQAEKRVERCIQHRHESEDLQENIRMNVLQSARKPGTGGVWYHGSVAHANSWFSVVVEFEPMSTENTHAYKFVCKNSCSSGINRRQIAIIFTLEDIGGRVHGRQMVGARVCSCLRRDMLKDQKAAGLPRKRSSDQPHPALTKVKMGKIEFQAAPDDGLFVLPPLEIVGRLPVIAGLEVMVRMMEQTLEMRQNDPQYVASITASIDSIKATIDSYRSLGTTKNE